MQLDRVRRDSGLAVVEVEERNPGNAGLEAQRTPRYSRWLPVPKAIP